MSNFENAGAPVPVSAKSPRAWDFLETTLIGLVAYGAFLLAAGLGLSVLIFAQHGTIPTAHAEFGGRWQGAALVFGTPAAVAVLWAAVRKLDRDFSEYLALNWPSSGELFLAFAIAAVLLIVEGYFRAFVGADTSWIAPSLNVQGRVGLLTFLIGGCLAAPIMEEFIVRGFLFRGWSQSFLGPVGAIVLTSVVWALNHTQYDWSDRFCIFVFGLALGYFRWRSNSTWLTVIVHSALNIISSFMIGPYV
ncbi:CPBP family intramembrane glutamic endopeptidase [Bradyrhizobium uaiense]|uniref:CPBP family intramembrane metalloprotease n=1 Tax=Bradyrhizobium uaiense TaxID=2594946 RepID=A0A6P1BA98_9BRAD|nr:CPBP family intramembrane glutamic endopeptidase [Bradyrhizobium uaiense]NEU94570.1 CPBP family intramembrane metalloprotease [Bradyrhizobium uaiense]